MLRAGSVARAREFAVAIGSWRSGHARDQRERETITVVGDEDEVFVGVLRKARGKGGSSLANVAEIHEFGAGPFVVPMTPKMRRFLFALLKKAGVEPSNSGGGKGVVVIQIPPRPFLRPAFEAFKKGVQKRFLQRIAQAIGLRV